MDVKKLLKAHKQRAARVRKKLDLMDRCGNQCQVPGCGEERVPCLTFHHKLEYAHLKRFQISSANMNRSMKSLLKELEICMLVCRHCHALIHAGWIDERGNKLPRYGDINSLSELYL